MTPATLVLRQAPEAVSPEVRDGWPAPTVPVLVAILQPIEADVQQVMGAPVRPERVVHRQPEQKTSPRPVARYNTD